MRIAPTVLDAPIFHVCNSLPAQAMVSTHTIFTGAHYGDIIPIIDVAHIILYMLDRYNCCVTQLLLVFLRTCGLHRHLQMVEREFLCISHMQLDACYNSFLA